MSQKETIYNLKQILEELKASEGLPENLSTEAQLWDEILKKETFLMPEQLFPLIKEIYGKSYPKDTPVKPLATEYSVERSDTKEITSVRADVTVLIGIHDIYHFECESKNDKTMVIRMFEYDVHIALSYHSSPLSLQFPHSAVLYLQDNGNIPDTLSCQIHFQDGGTYEYKIPTIKVQTYSLEDIREKHLSILIPFLPLRFRKFIRPSKNKRKFTKEELTSFYQQLILILDKEVQDHYLSENNRNVILNLLNKSLIRVFYPDKSLLGEVVTMTEPILELEIEKYIHAVDEKINELNLLSEKLAETDLELSQTKDALSQANLDLCATKDELSQANLDLCTTKDELSQANLDLCATKDELSRANLDLCATKDTLAQKDEEISFLKSQLAKLQITS